MMRRKYIIIWWRIHQNRHNLEIKNLKNLKISEKILVRNSLICYTH